MINKVLRVYVYNIGRVAMHDNDKAAASVRTPSSSIIARDCSMLELCRRYVVVNDESKNIGGAMSARQSAKQ